MAAVQLADDHLPRVVVLDGETRIVDLVDTDPRVHRVLADADDPEEATHALLRVGAQAALIAGADLDADVVERRFEGLARHLDTSVGTAVSRIGQVSSDLLDGQNGQLAHILNQTRTGLKDMLDSTFNPDSKSSAIAKIDAVFEDAVRQIEGKVKTSLDPDNPGSALGKAKREIVEAVRETAREQGRQLQELAVAVEAAKARAQVTELTAVKGFSYENLLQRGLAGIAAVHGDITEPVGRKTGLSGTMKGDHLVTINPEDTAGEQARFVIECKDRQLSMTKTMDELGKAMTNHAARAAVAVFSRAEHAQPRSRSPGPATTPCSSTTRTTRTATPSSSPTPGPAGPAAET